MNFMLMDLLNLDHTFQEYAVTGAMQKYFHIIETVDHQASGQNDVASVSYLHLETVKRDSCLIIMVDLMSMRQRTYLRDASIKQ